MVVVELGEHVVGKLPLLLVDRRLVLVLELLLDAVQLGKRVLALLARRARRRVLAQVMARVGDLRDQLGLLLVERGVAELLARYSLSAKIVLITNASLLDRPSVQPAIAFLDSHNGEIWAKLDAGTEAYYNLVARSAIPFARILENLRDAARERPIVIQSLFMRIRGEPPSPAEQAAYCDRLAEIVAAGGRIKLVQVHTIARPPAESWVAPLENAEVDALADLARRRQQLAPRR